jgi:hypothetical protein
MKSIYSLLFFAALLASCSSAPSGDAIQTAIAQTQLAQPTSTPIPTNTPYPTYTPFPTVSPTKVPIPTVTLAPATSCTEENFKLIDIDPASGLGVFVNISCSEKDPSSLFSVMVIVPVGAPSYMVDDAMIYLYGVVSQGGWDVDDFMAVYHLETRGCSVELATSGKINGFCIASGKTTTITSYVTIP